MATAENLVKAFRGESEANRRYLAYAIKAEQEGYPVISKLFRCVAEAETVHAFGHFKSMDGVRSTKENLQAAMEGERWEHTEMYPPMLKAAQEEKHKGAKMFKYALEAEKVHEKLFAKALESVKQGKDLSECSFFVCPVCGFVEEGDAPDKCPICGTDSLLFKKIN